MTADTPQANAPQFVATASARENDHADVKELVKLTALTVEAYREFYKEGAKSNASAKARKALQEIRVKTAAMRKQVQADRAAQLAKQNPA